MQLIHWSAYNDGITTLADACIRSIFSKRAARPCFFHSMFYLKDMDAICIYIRRSLLICLQMKRQWW